MHDDGELRCGSPTRGPAFDPSTDNTTVAVGGAFNLHDAPILHAAAALRPGAHLGSGIADQGESIVGRLEPC
jgi:NAD(P)H-hydrate repair Nnr-like enzyme with NAD(P)H-hydrate dehydratase domain